VERRVELTAQAVVRIAIFDKNTMPEQAGNWILFNPPAEIITRLNEHKTIRVRANQHHRVEPGERDSKDVSKMRMKDFKRRQQTALPQECLQPLKRDALVRHGNCGQAQVTFTCNSRGAIQLRPCEFETD
jgi:hypothetical protein